LIGIGQTLDTRGRYYLFQKNKEKRFPNKEEITDKLVALSMLYGSSNNINTTQIQYKKSYPELSRKPSMLLHEHPAKLSEQGQKIKNFKPPVPVLSFYLKIY